MAEDPDESVPEASPNQPWNSARAPFPREIVPTSRRAVVIVPASYQPAVKAVAYAGTIRRLYWILPPAIATLVPFMRMGAEPLRDPDASALQPMNAWRVPQ